MRFLILLGLICFLGCDEGAAPATDPSTDGFVPAPTDGALPDAEQAPADASVVPDVEVESDVEVPEPDAEMVEPDGSSPIEDAEVPEPHGGTPSWWDCRRALTSDRLSEEERAHCDALHSEPPDTRRYGIRWVFIAEVEDADGWAADKINLMNEVFAPVGFEFQTESTVTIAEPIIDIGVSEDEHRLGDLGSEIAQYLEIQEGDPESMVEALIERLREAGVGAMALEGLSTETEMTPQLFLSMMARARPEEIHVMVLPRVNAGGAGGMSSPPGTNPIARGVSVINIKPGAALPALPHEFGHFFGLKHPHGSSEAGTGEANFNFQEHMSRRPGSIDPLESIYDVLGDELEGPLGEPFPAYNDRTPQMRAFEALRYSASLLHLVWRYTYRIGDDGPEAFADLPSFIDWATSGAAIYYKNFLITNGRRIENNCRVDDVLEIIVCDLGDPSVAMPGDGAFLDGSITLDDGRTANIMSYIGKVLDVTRDELLVDFLPEQTEVMRVVANTPVRLLLRNYALGDE